MYKDEAAVANKCADYYARFKGKAVTSVQVWKQGKRDRDGFQKFFVVINVEPHHAYVFSVYEKCGARL